MIFFKGVRLWGRDKKLLALSVTPLVVDFIFVVVSLAYAVPRIPTLVNLIMREPTIWYRLLFYYFVFALTALSILLIVILITILVANLVTFPFNDLLSKRTLLLCLPQDQLGLVDKKRVKAINNAAAMARKTLILVIAAILLFTAALVPGLGIAVGFISMLIMAFDRVDYSFDHCGLNFKQRKLFIKSSFLEFVGFALALGLTSFIPVVNILLVPASVVSGACLFAELLKKDTSIERFNSSSPR